MPTNARAMSQETLTALGRAIENLVFLSESDEPFELVDWDLSGQLLDQRRLLELGKHHPDSPVTVISVDDFFADLVRVQEWHGQHEKETVAKYQALLSILKQHLECIQVFCVGKIRKSIYVVGRCKDGRWAGVKTVSVET